MADQFWTPEPLFDGATVFALGGGPSLTQQDVDRLRDLPTIAANEAAKLAPWSVLFFRDLQWYVKNRKFVDNRGGLSVTSNRGASCGGVKRIQLVHGDQFPQIGSGTVKYGRTSGHQAVSLAVAMGAKRIILIGFDCKMLNGKSHFHNEYRGHESLYRNDFLLHWRGWGLAATHAGVDILNATSGSAIDEFPIVDLSVALRCGAARQEAERRGSWRSDAVSGFNEYITLPSSEQGQR